MEIAGFVVAVLALVASCVSWVFSHAANKTAKKAHELQATIDSRQREFRDVSWKRGYNDDVDGNILLTLTNVGLTPARQVTIVFAYDGERRARYLGDIDPGETASTMYAENRHGETLIAKLFGDEPFLVHWSSPTGKAKRYEHPGMQLG